MFPESIKLEAIRIALSMHSSGPNPFTARDVVASARIIERYVSGTKRAKSDGAAIGSSGAQFATGANSARPSLNPVEKSA